MSPQPRSTSQARLFQAALTALVAAPVAAYLIWDLSKLGKFSLGRPWALLLLLAVPYVAWLGFGLAHRRRPHMKYSQLSVLGRLPQGIVARLASLPFVFRLVAVTLMVLALAKPLTSDRSTRVDVEGIDVVLALDLSQSMEAADLYPNRLEAAKRVIDEFIARRKGRGDRIGLVVFGKEAYTQCPLTLDHLVLRNMLRDLQLGLINGAGTAIGNALGVSLARLRRSDAKSRVVILVTDGENNAGNVTPTESARYAQSMKVKVFTILMGPSKTTSRQYPVNPKLLQDISARTGAQSYLATDTQALRKNFEDILNALDRSVRKDVGPRFNDAFRPFLLLALLFVLLEVILRLTRFREFP